MALTDKVLQLLANGTFKRIADAGVAEVGSGIQNTLGNLTITGQSGFAVVFNGSAANIDVRMAGQTQANLFFLDASTDRIGLGNNSPSSLLDLAGAFTVRGMVAPAVSPATQGRLYFDSGTNKWRVSENGAAYVDLVATGTVSGTGVNNQVAVWSGTSSLDGSTGFTWDSATSAFAVDGSATFNDSAANRDFRVEGVTEPNLLFLDASADLVGIGTATPTARLHVKGSANPSIVSESTSTTGYGSVEAWNNLTNYTQMLAGDSAVVATWFPTGANISRANVGGLRTQGLSGMIFAAFDNVPLYLGQGDINRLDLLPTEAVFNNPGFNYDFRVEGDTDPNLLFVDASTDRVGVGTATPASIFHVEKDQNAATILNLWNTANGVDASAYYSVISQNNGLKGVANSDSFVRSYPGFQPGSTVLLAGATGGLTIGSGLGTGTAGANTGVIRFVTDTVDLTSLLTGNDSRTRMVITAVGRVGVNTLTPAGRQEVRDDTSTVNLILTKEGVTGANDLLEFRTDAFSSLERHTMRWTSSSGAVVLGRYGMEYDATLNTVDFVWRDQFNVSAGSTETMRLKGNGRLGIGTSAPAYNLHVIGSALISGNLTVQGSTTTVSSETVLIDDNHLYINNNYTAVSAQTGGLVVNYLPTATTTTVNGSYTAGVAAVSNPTVGTVGAATFTVGSFIQFSGGTTPVNSGLYEVLSHAANVLIIRGIGVTGTVEDFTQNQFETAPSDGAVITQVTVSIMRAGTDGVWEVGQGLATPVVFTDLGMAGSGMAIGNTITSATAGSVLFAGALGVLAQDNANFFWDDANDQLELGDGSFGNPAYSFKSSTTTGIYLISGEMVLRSASGTQRNIRVVGDTVLFGSSTFVTIDHGLNRMSIGAALSDASLSVNSIVATPTRYGTFMSGTLTPTASSAIGHNWSITGAGSGAGTLYGWLISVPNGFTGASSVAATISNESNATGTLDFRTSDIVPSTSYGTIGMWVQGDPSNSPGTAGSVTGLLGHAFTTSGAATGAQIMIGVVGAAGAAGGYAGQSTGKDGFAAGILGVSIQAKHTGSTTEKHIGVQGQALNGDINVAGYFGLTASVPTYASAVLVADNGTTGADIFVGVAAATNTFVVNGVGNLTLIRSVPYSWPAAQGAASTVLTNDGAGTLSWTAASGGMAIGGSITSATAGSVLFAGVAGVLAQDNANLFFDDTNNRLGIRTATPGSSLDVTGSVGFQVTSVSTNTTLDETHHTVLVDASGGAITITLPTASASTRRRYEIKKTDSSSNSVTVDANGSETIDGALTWPVPNQYNVVTIVCDGTSWYVL